MKRSLLYTLLTTLLLSLAGCGGGVSDTYAITKVYENGEDGSAARWSRYNICPYDAQNVAGGAQGSARSIFLRQNWVKQPDGSYKNEAGYILHNADGSDWNDTLRTILDFDKMKRFSADQMLYCFDCGVELDTAQGPRRLVFSTWFDKNHTPPQRKEFPHIVEFTFPLSMEYVQKPDVWQHLHFDLNDYLHRFEPDNTITSVRFFFFEGGDDYLDNISLSRARP